MSSILFHRMKRGGRHLVFILFMALMMGFHIAQAHEILDKVLKLRALMMGFHIAQAHEILDKVLKLRVLLMGFRIAQAHIILDKVLKLRPLLMGFLIAQAHEINPLLQGNTMLFNTDNHNIYL
mgnify:CR=1 FL=1